MAFSDNDIERVRKYLGYPIEQSSKANINFALAKVTNFGVDAENTIKLLLEQLDTIDKQLRQATPFAGQSFSSDAAGTKQYTPGARMENFRAEGRRRAWELKESTQLLMYKDYFAAPGSWQTSGSTIRS